MKIRNLLAFVVIMLIPTVMKAQTVTGVNIVNYQAKAIDSNPKMFVIPIVSSLEIIQNAPKVFNMNGIIKLPANGQPNRPALSESEYMSYVDRTVKNRIEELKSQALFDYSEETGADLILSPMYSITTDSSDGLIVKVSVKVKGYPAKYTKFREMTENDTKLVSTAGLIDEDIDMQTLNSKSLTNNETIIRK